MGVLGITDLSELEKGTIFFSRNDFLILINEYIDKLPKEKTKKSKKKKEI